MLNTIVAAEGPRIPSFENSPEHFREAWILLYRPANPPTAEQISKLNAVRNAWPGFCQHITKGRGQITTSLL